MTSRKYPLVAMLQIIWVWSELHGHGIKFSCKFEYPISPLEIEIQQQVIWVGSHTQPWAPSNLDFEYMLFHVFGKQRVPVYLFWSWVHSVLTSTSTMAIIYNFDRKSITRSIFISGITHSVTYRMPEVKLYLVNTVSNAMFRYNSRWNLAAASKNVIFAVTSNTFYRITCLIFQGGTLKEIHVKSQHQIGIPECWHSM